MKPARTKWKFIVDFRVLSILLLIALIPFLVGTWWLVNGYRTSYLESQGRNLAEEAEVAFGQLNDYLGNQIIDVAGLAEVPTLREAIERSNRELAGDEKAARKSIDAVQSRWNALDYRSPELRAVLENPASDFLRRYTALRPSYREIIVTDVMARTVAATGKTSDFQHAGDQWWKTAYADGHKGGVYVGDVHFDESIHTNCFVLAQPFVDPRGGVMGVLMAAIDAQEIHALVGSLRTGFGGTATLLRTNGGIISAPGFGFLDRRTFPGMAEIRVARDSGKGFAVSNAKPRTIYGLGSRSFAETYPYLNWILVVSGPADAVVGPLTQLLRNIVLLMLAIVALTTLAVLWLSRTESRPILEEDAHFERI